MDGRGEGGEERVKGMRAQQDGEEEIQMGI